MAAMVQGFVGCPVCRSAEGESLPPTGDAFSFNCPACGRFIVTGTHAEFFKRRRELRCSPSSDACRLDANRGARDGGFLPPQARECVRATYSWDRASLSLPLMAGEPVS